MITIEATPIPQRITAFAGLGVPAEALAAALAPPRQADDHSVLAFSRDALPAVRGISGIRRRGHTLVLGHLEPDELHRFEPISVVEMPTADAYFLVDVDLGASSRNATPESALAEIIESGRSPLTLEEGIALMLQQPEAIERNWGFSMAGSRRGDQRVPAFWVSERKPKLGWCWDRNPHTWLGTASCAARRPA